MRRAVQALGPAAFALGIVGCSFDPSGLPVEGGGGDDDGTQGGVDASFAIVDATIDPPDAAPPDAATCPEGWAEKDDRCYLVGVEGKSWGDARAACVALAADLASTPTMAEDELVRGLVDDGRAYWLGAFDGNDADEGKWQWVDGSPWGFERWGTFQPDNWFNEDCLERQGDSWNDAECGDAKAYVCERPRG